MTAQCPDDSRGDRAETKGAGRLQGAVRGRPGGREGQAGGREDSSFWSWLPTAHASQVLVSRPLFLALVLLILNKQTARYFSSKNEFIAENCNLGFATTVSHT